MSVEADEIPLFICEIEQFGGAERSLLALSAWLARHGRPNYLLTYFDRCDVARYATHPLKVVALNPAPGVRAKIASLKAHFVARPAGSPQPVFSGYQPALHGTLAGLRGFHDLMHDTSSLFGDEPQRSWKGWIRIWVSNRIISRGLRSGGTTIVTSEFLQSECRRDFGVEAKIARMGGLSAAPSPQSQRPAPGVCRDRLNMLSVCRIEANKRIDWLLRSLAQLEQTAIPPLGRNLSSIADWHLHLAGKGSRIPEIARLAESLGIASRVHLHGFVPDEELDDLYAQANLFLMPAVQGYGIPAIEALAHGIPILLHRDSGVSDILLDTPWATVLHGGEESLTPRLAEAIEGVLTGRHLSIGPPALPTEDEWARRVAELCHYVHSDNPSAGPPY